MAYTIQDLDRQLQDDTGPEDNALLAPGSDGLIYGEGPHILKEMYRRREDGASLAQIRRDTGQAGNFNVTNRVLENCIEQGRLINDYETKGYTTPPTRYYHGFSACICTLCGDKWLLHRMIKHGDAYICRTCASH